ncbi:MAG TPA: DUF1592 domain-containing protein [Polyangia bacterium]|nr:DUF1592 domain-containing protein [Polyangia bacterium]
MSKLLACSGAWGVLVAAAGCMGSIGGTQPTVGSGGGPQPPTGSGGNAAVAFGDPGVGQIHRLNSTEYNNTVADVLGTKLQPATVSWRSEEYDGFDNISASLGIDDKQYDLYVDAAGAIADDVFASDALRAKIVSCTTVDDDACVKSIISQTGLRLFRRPLLDTEIASFQKAYVAARQLGEDHNGAVKNVLWSLLSSGEFLYRMEFDNGNATRHLVGGYELASRLSYFLWSSAPDDALLAAADKLNTPEAINSTVDRLLHDPKSQRLVTNFAGQWLGARGLAAHPVQPDIYPAWSPDVADAAATEMYQYFDEFLHNDRPWSDFLKADINFVNGTLASFYGIPNVNGTQTQRVAYTADDRFGFLGLAGFLAISSQDRRSSPTIRGKWMLMNLLCTPPPPPPTGPMKPPPLEATNSNTATGNVRQILEEHRKNPACAACHASIDPFGLALEEFDGIGKFRTNYADGSPIDASTELPPSAAFPMGITFTGLKGAADTMAAEPMAKQCLTNKLFEYASGRSLTFDDTMSIAMIERTWETGGPLTINRLLHTIALGDPFRYRNPASPSAQ